MLTLWQQLRTKHLHWQLDNQSEFQQLKQRQALAEQDLVAELSKRSAQLEHELAMLQTSQTAQLDILKAQCQQDVKDYKHYLQALEQLKISLQKHYAHLPDAVAFTIHHHAKHLLNAMWEAENLEAKMRHEMQLLQLLASVHEDARNCLASSPKVEYPEHTLKLLNTHVAIPGQDVRR